MVLPCCPPTRKMAASYTYNWANSRNTGIKISFDCLRCTAAFRFEFGIFSFFKLLNAPADCMVKKTLNKIFRPYCVAFRGFSRNIDMVSSKSGLWDQKKLTAAFRFYQFLLVVLLSHWYQHWVRAAPACFETC